MREIRDNNSMYTLNQDDIQMYLKDLRQIDVMTPEREKELSNIMCSNDCTQKQRDEIHKELLEGNLRFVITVAKQYQNQGLDMSDLIAEGNYGLMKAIKNFDWTKTADIFKKGNVHKCVHTPSKNPLMISMCRTDYYTNTRKGGITIARFITKNY